MRNFLLLLLMVLPISASAFPKGGIEGTFPYLGPVATAAMIPNILNTSGSGMTRKAHIARDGITSLKLVYANWLVDFLPPNNGSEVTTGNSISVQSWVEYPVGVYTPVLFSSSSTATIPTLTTTLSDATSVTIPNGATFFTWTHVTGSGGTNFPYYSTSTAGNPLYTAGGEAANFGASPPSSPGAISDNFSGRRGYWPSAILGMTSKPTFYLIGDSRCAGVDEVANGSFDLGDVARSVGPTYAYINGCIGGQRAAAWFNSHTLQNAISQYASIVIDQLGYNEFNQQNMNVATVEQYKLNLSAHFNGRKYARTTIEPWTSSTDLWATTSNQTLNPNTAGMNTYNDWIRTLPNSITYGEISNAVSTAQDSGIWVVNGTARYSTVDGIHPSTTGSLLIQSFGGVNPTTISTYPIVNTVFASLNLTPGGTPSYGTGNFSQALAGGWGSITGIAPGSSPFTEELWAKTSSTSSLYALSSNIGIFTQAATGNACVHAGDGSNTCSSIPIADNAWHHIAVVYSSGVITLYVDGVSATTHAISLQNSQLGNQNAAVLRASTTAGASQWGGSIDEVAMWNFAKYTTSFTPPVSPYTGNETGLIAVWHLDNNLNGVRGPGGM